LSQQLFPAEALGQQVDQEHRPVFELQGLQAHGVAAAEGVGVDGAGVLDSPVDRVAGVGRGAPSIALAAEQADDTGVAPRAAGKELDAALAIHLHRILSIPSAGIESL